MTLSPTLRLFVHFPLCSHMIATLLLSLLLPSSTAADVFTSTAAIEALVDAEEEIANVIDEFVTREQRRLDRLKKFANDYRINKAKAGEREELVGNPLNAFLLIKRLTVDWRHIQSIMKNNNFEEFVADMNNTGREFRLPDDEDLEGAALALLRLQDTYDLHTHQLANGIIGRERSSNDISLTAGDCYEIGRVAFHYNDFPYTIQWMQEALDRLPDEQTSLGDVLEHLSFAHFKEGNREKALNLTKELIQMNHSFTIEDIPWYEQVLTVDENEEKREQMNESDGKETIDEYDSYEALCRGEREIPQINPREERRLFCFFKADRPFLRLAPIKAEILHRRPLLVAFRQVISEREIGLIKQLALTRMDRAVITAPDGSQRPAEYRISKVAWLGGEDDKTVETIDKRLALMSNLNLKTAERLQVGNYGIGGHYEPHFDMITEATHHRRTFPDHLGNRIATIIVYLSRPQLGGATVFTEINTAIFPSKGDAIFWYNLRLDGEPDLLTRHAGCPVLIGNKWILNKWFHERGQEVHRPCGLTKNAIERYPGDLSLD